MPFIIIQGTTYSVDASTGEEAREIFQRFMDGTATTEDQSKIINQQTSGFEVQGEYGGPVGDGTI